MPSRRCLRVALGLPILMAAALEAQTVQRAPTAIPPRASVTRDPTYVPPKPPPPERTTLSQPLEAMRAWETMPGCAKAIAAARAEQLFMLGCAQADANGWTINYWDANGRAWFPFPNGSALQIEAHPDGRPFVLRGNTRGYQWRTGDVGDLGFTTYDAAWRAIWSEGDCWRSVAVSRTAIWRVTCENGGGGGFRLWVRPMVPNSRLTLGYIPGALERVAANDADEYSPGVWGVGSGGAIWRSVWTNNPQAPLAWVQLPGCARSLAAGGGHVVVIGCDEPDVNGDRSLWHWNGQAFDELPGRASDLAIAPEGVLYAVSGTGEIKRYKNALPIPAAPNPGAMSGTTLP